MIYLLKGVLHIFQEIVKKYGKMVIAPGIICVFILFYFLQQNRSEEAELISTIPQQQELSIESETIPNEQETSSKVIVDVKGAVKFPGVYELTSEDRIIDAIQMAGGYLEEADSKYINHAQKLQDEMIIYIPKKGESLEVEQPVAQSISIIGSTPSGKNDGKVNINTASESELTSLPGIGPTKAQAIIQYRQENGSFKTIDDIKNVSGIGEKTFEKLKDSITVK